MPAVYGTFTAVSASLSNEPIPMPKTLLNKGVSTTGTTFRVPPGVYYVGFSVVSYPEVGLGSVKLSLYRGDYLWDFWAIASDFHSPSYRGNVIPISGEAIEVWAESTGEFFSPTITFYSLDEGVSPDPCLPFYWRNGYGSWGITSPVQPDAEEVAFPGQSVVPVGVSNERVTGEGVWLAVTSITLLGEKEEAKGAVTLLPPTTTSPFPFIGHEMQPNVGLDGVVVESAKVSAWSTFKRPVGYATLSLAKVEKRLGYASFGSDPNTTPQIDPVVSFPESRFPPVGVVGKTTSFGVSPGTWLVVYSLVGNHSPPKSLLGAGTSPITVTVSLIVDGKVWNTVGGSTTTAGLAISFSQPNIISSENEMEVSVEFSGSLWYSPLISFVQLVAPPGLCC